jgi:hypothetical protein
MEPAAVGRTVTVFLVELLVLFPVGRFPLPVDSVGDILADLDDFQDVIGPHFDLVLGLVRINLAEEPEQNSHRKG